MWSVEQRERRRREFEFVLMTISTHAMFTLHIFRMDVNQQTFNVATTHGTLTATRKIYKTKISRMRLTASSTEIITSPRYESCDVCHARCQSSLYVFISFHFSPPHLLQCCLRVGKVSEKREKRDDGESRNWEKRKIESMRDFRDFFGSVKKV